MKVTPRCSIRSLLTCQNLGLKIFELDMPLFTPLCCVLQDSLKEFNLGRQLFLLIQHGLYLVFSDLFLVRY